MKHHRFLVGSLALICGAFLGGCADLSATGARIPVEPIALQVVQLAEDPAGLSEEELGVLSEARAVLAAHLKLPNVTNAELVLIRSTVWPNGGRGCGQPGFFYIQSEIDGYKVVLALNGVQHHIHMSVTSHIDSGQLYRASSGLVCEQLQDSVLANNERGGEVPIPNASQIPQTK